MSGAIQADAHFDRDIGMDDDAAAFLQLFKDADKKQPPVDDDEKETTEGLPEEDAEDTKAPAEKPEDDGDEDNSEDDSDDTDDEGDDEEDGASKILDDKAVVKVKVGDEELAVPVKDLKRLYGQEKALTHKSMEVATKRKELEDLGAKHVAASDALLQRAAARYEPYAKIDWALAVKELDSDEYKALRSEAVKAYEDVQFLRGNLDGYMKQVEAVRTQELINEAKATLQELSDPVKGIKGFNEAVYNEMRQFAVSQGMPESAVNTLVSAPALRLIHKAMLYEKGKTAPTTPKDKKPKKIIKGKTAPTARPQGRPDKAAMNRLATTGSTDDAAEAFLSRWGSMDD